MSIALTTLQYLTMLVIRDAETLAGDNILDNPLDPLENVTGGTRYLRTLLDSYDGNVALSLAAYNAGPGRVKDAIPNIPETRTYVARVLRHYASYRQAR